VRTGFELKGKRVLVVGLARTGIATAQFCVNRGAIVTAMDQQPEGLFGAAAQTLRAAGIALELGGHRSEIFENQDLIVLSPGVPAKLPPLEAARLRGIPVWSEIELASRFLRGRLIAITGSNGKTTTTALVAHILKTANIPALVGGNIGVPLISLVDSSSDSTVSVVEASSFQLETIAEFRPEIAVMLNLTPDHLDRHTSFEEYVRAKMRIFENQHEDDDAILNADDPEVAKRFPARPQVHWFSRQKRVASGAYVRDGLIVVRTGGNEEPIMQREEISLRGGHNLENVLAACIATRLAGAHPSAIAEGVRTFPGVEHRIEFVAEINGVKFYNDSKATNVDATLKAITAFASPLIVILGGKDKGSPYTPLVDPLRKNARLVLLIGAATEKISAELSGAFPITNAGTMDRAVELAFERAQPGDTVLLAPACASFDQFENFEHRGRVFKELVARLVEKNKAKAPPNAATRSA
jgi:UDP-N-acetylmuramoylalanine--D-glutamate ligase